MVTLPSSSGETIKEDVPTKLKQFMGHVMDEQQSSMTFFEGGFFGQQSMSSMEDMSDISANFALTAAPPLVGSRATDRASNRIRKVRGPLPILCRDPQQKTQAA
jgi:hypothetical protein